MNYYNTIIHRGAYKDGKFYINSGISTRKLVIKLIPKVCKSMSICSHDTCDESCILFKDILESIPEDYLIPLDSVESFKVDEYMSLLMNNLLHEYDYNFSSKFCNSISKLMDSELNKINI